MTEETKQIIDITLNALSVFGTLAAVVVALYLAGQARKERIKGRAGIRMVGRAGGSLSATVVFISATNLSDRPITVSGFGWRVGILKKTSFVQIPDFSNPMSDGLPKKIDYGDSVNLVFDVEKFFSAPGQMCEHLSLFFPWLTKRYMFCLISTTGSPRDFKIRVESSLADRFIEEKRKIKS